ncbi:MAG TPA: hypothetical protein VI282_17300 [Verrucomicrobiae bacterium]|jgi:hypothetical protein
MNDPESPISPASSPSSDSQTIYEMRGAIESLRGVFQVVALSGIVLSATVMMYLYQQVSVVRRQNDELIAYINEFNTNVVPRVEMARTNLQVFAKTNASIEPLVRKYFPPTNAAPSKP